MPFLTRFSRPLQLCCLAYLSVSVVYTTLIILKSPIHAFCQVLSDLGTAQLAHWSPLQHILHGFAPSINGLDNGEAHSRVQQNLIHWESSDLVLKYGLGHHDRVPMNEELFLSKAFANSMHPSKIIPYYYRALANFDPQDITITTLVTSNRLQVFAQLAERYQGPISVTVHVTNSSSHLHDLLDSLHTLYTSSPSMFTYVDVHLVIDNFDRQFNTWRNIARLFARTDFIMMLDVDFAICTDFRSAIRNSKPVMDKLRGGLTALVIPAFEYVKLSEGTDQSMFPKDKASLLSLVKANRIGMFHSYWAAGHNSTDYERYYTAEPGEVYKVTRYQHAYEPYVIFRKEGPPWCDERFVGYGGNKAACLFEMYLSGISFYVLADHFIVHQTHLYDEPIRNDERKHNRRIYTEFKEETCLRYLKAFHEDGLLNTSRGYNVQDECKNVKGISKVALQILNTHI